MGDTAAGPLVTNDVYPPADSSLYFNAFTRDYARISTKIVSRGTLLLAQRSSFATCSLTCSLPMPIAQAGSLP
jgi:hypothetical protein